MEYTGQELVTLTPEELASQARKQENEKIREHARWEAERGKDQKEATTDQFQSGPSLPPNPFLRPLISSECLPPAQRGPSLPAFAIFPVR